MTTTALISADLLALPLPGGELVLTPVPGGELGVWEAAPGVQTDVEVDEVFVVLAGAATVEVVDVHDGAVVLEGPAGGAEVARLLAGTVPGVLEVVTEPDAAAPPAATPPPRPTRRRAP